MSAFYNEIEPFAVDWLRSLVAEGHIATGTVDSRSVKSIQPEDIHGAQAHFFAGIGAWSYALRLAGWPDDLPVWTGSCPCQPFSTAGQGRGEADERHLWPDWHRLIAECRPPVVFGEQVASPAGRRWFATVRLQMEELGYAVGAADLCAAGVGAPHIRQRIFFGAVRLGDTHGERTGGNSRGPSGEEAEGSRGGSLSRGLRHAAHLPGSDSPLAYPRSEGRQQVGSVGGRRSERGSAEGLEQRLEYGCSGSRLVNPTGRAGFQVADLDLGCGRAPTGLREVGVQRDVGQSADPWRDCEWLPCRDGKARPAEPGTFPLAHGAPESVGRLRGYGNAIIPHVAATFILSFLEALEDLNEV